MRRDYIENVFRNFSEIMCCFCGVGCGFLFWADVLYEILNKIGVNRLFRNYER